MALAVIATVIGAFGFGYFRGHLDGIDQAWQVARKSVDRERERCRQAQLGRLYGAEVISRPSKAAVN